MIELVRTNDVVFLSWLKHALDGKGIDYVVMDEHMAVMEGTIGVLPRRVMVDEADQSAARVILAEGKALGES